MTQRLTCLVASLASGVALVLLVVVLPVSLWLLVGWPLPTSVPRFGVVATAVEQRNVGGEVVVKALAVVIWVLWAQLVWALVWEVLVNGRRLARGLRSTPAPGVAGPLNALAARLVSGLLVASIAVTTVVGSASLPSTPTLAQTMLADSGGPAPPDRSAVVTRQEAVATPTGPRWLVKDGDSLWSIAATTFGDGARSSDVLALNPQLTSARDIEPGMILAMPVGAEIPNDRIPTTESGSVVEASTAARDRAETEVEVSVGDNLWRLSERRLGAVDAEPSVADIAGYVGEIVAANQARIEDPDLIYPGQVLTFPLRRDAPRPSAEPSEVDSRAAVSTTSPATDEAEGGSSDERRRRPGPQLRFGEEAEILGPPPGDPAATGLDAAEAGADAGPAPDGDPEHDLEGDRGGDNRVAAAAPDETGADAGPAPDGDLAHDLDGEGDDRVSEAGGAARAPLVFGAAGALLAAGALDLLRRRRRYRLAHRRPGTVPAAPSPDLDDAARALAREADAEARRWVTTALASLGTRPVYEGEAVAQPVIARLAPDHLEVEFSAPDGMAAPVPWENVDGGWCWRLDRAAGLVVEPGVVRPAAAPTLVTVGTDLMVNLEALGVLSVDGPLDEGLALTRSLVHEMATSASEVAVDVRSTLPLIGTDAYGMVRVQSPTDLLAELPPWLTDVEERLAAHLSSNAYSHRLAVEQDHIAPVVVITDDDGAAVMAPIVATASRRVLPLAVVIVGGQPQPGEAGIAFEADGARLDPWGIDFEPQTLSVVAARRLSALLADASSDHEEQVPTELHRSASVADIAGPGRSSAGRSRPASVIDDSSVRLSVLANSVPASGTASPTTETSSSPTALPSDDALGREDANAPATPHTSTTRQPTPPANDQPPEVSEPIAAATTPDRPAGINDAAAVSAPGGLAGTDDAPAASGPGRPAGINDAAAASAPDGLAGTDDAPTVPAPDAPGTQGLAGEAVDESADRAPAPTDHHDGQQQNGTSSSGAPVPAVARSLPTPVPSSGEPAEGTAEPAAKGAPGWPADGELVIRVLGHVEAEGTAEALTSQQLSLLCYLACHGSSSREAVIDALWDGQIISKGRFPNLLAETRARIGRHHFPEARDGRYELAGVTTDLARFELGVLTAQAQDPAEAIRTLRPIVALIRGVPLTPPGRRFWSWVGDHSHVGARIEALVADTAARLAHLEQELGNLAGARWACEQGLRASPADETLVIALTEVYLELGKPALARRLVDQWEDTISRLDCGEPSDEPRRRLAG